MILTHMYIIYPLNVRIVLFLFHGSKLQTSGTSKSQTRGAQLDTQTTVSQERRELLQARTLCCSRVRLVETSNVLWCR